MASRLIESLRIIHEAVQGVAGEFSQSSKRIRERVRGGNLGDGSFHERETVLAELEKIAVQAESLQAAVLELRHLLRSMKQIDGKSEGGSDE